MHRLVGYGYITKIDSEGEKVWEKSLRRDSYSQDSNGPVYAIVPTSDGGYLLGRGNSYESSNGTGYITKIDSKGETVWEKSIGQNNGVYYGPVYAICESK